MILNIIFFILIIIGLSLTFYLAIRNKNWNNKPIPTTKEPSYAILIPARDESRVITDLLESIINQTDKVNPNDIYIIIENSKDKTFEIAKKYNANVIIRKHLNLKRKGYALDEGIKDILSKNKHYDMYFIFDADNILDPNFIVEMKKSYKLGYDIAISYRNGKNGNTNLVSAASTLTFSLMNNIFNKNRVKVGGNCAISGTGFYIKGKFIEQWQGFPFHSLTEDYEMTLYSISENLSSTYNENAIFYDEQPTKFKQSIKQRTRWIKGFFEARKTYIPKIKQKFQQNMSQNTYLLGDIFGLIPYIFLFIGLAGLIINNLVIGIVFTVINKAFSPMLWIPIGIILAIYLIFMIVTIYLIFKDKKINLKKSMKFKMLFYHPIFLITYINCFFKAILKKEITWEKIEHKARGIS